VLWRRVTNAGKALQSSCHGLGVWSHCVAWIVWKAHGRCFGESVSVSDERKKEQGRAHEMSAQRAALRTALDEAV